MSACESLARLIERKPLLFLMPREDWGAKKRNREKGGGRNEIRVDGELWGELGRHGKKPEAVESTGALGSDRGCGWVGGRWEGERREKGCGQMSNTREVVRGGLQFSAGWGSLVPISENFYCLGTPADQVCEDGRQSVGHLMIYNKYTRMPLKTNSSPTG